MNLVHVPTYKRWILSFGVNKQHGHPGEECKYFSLIKLINVSVIANSIFGGFNW